MRLVIELGQEPYKQKSQLIIISPLFVVEPFLRVGRKLPVIPLD
jgi:hypothetical protein